MNLELMRERKSIDVKENNSPLKPLDIYSSKGIIAFKKNNLNFFKKIGSQNRDKGYLVEEYLDRFDEWNFEISDNLYEKIFEIANITDGTPYRMKLISYEYNTINTCMIISTKVRQSDNNIYSSYDGKEYRTRIGSYHALEWLDENKNYKFTNVIAINRDILIGLMMFEKWLEGTDCEKKSRYNFIDAYNEEISNKIYLNLSNSDYARAFEDKKNVNKRTLEVMGNTELNKLFDFVEIDNSVDLSKYKMFEDKVMNFPLKNLIHRDVKFRIRKLGKHNARGIYFPFYKTLCIDTRYTNSFVHELGHSIDYLYTRDVKGRNISSTNLFKNIRIKMCKKIYGANVGNSDYYTTPTEIFARCFEFWFNRKFNQNDENKMLITDFNNLDKEKSVVYDFDNEDFELMETIISSL